MAAATWRYRGDPDAERPAALVRFANGKLQQPDSLSFTVYRNRDTAHPRKRHRRILVSETERLCYVGHNFGNEVMKCNSLCRYFVGVLDKNSGQMDVYNAEIFNMQPLLSDNLIPDDTKEYQTKSYREKMDLCIEAFGTSKQKRALSSRRMNAVGNDIVNTAVTKAAANIIDAKGVTDPMGPECPHIISRKLMKNFTSLTYNDGSIQNLVSASMKAKITAYVIALALHINNFQTDLTVLQNDMKLPESRILDIAKALRLRISKAKGMPGMENDENHKLGTLSLPLPTQKAPEGQRKRKKMN